MPRLSSKNQVTLPVRILRAAGLRPGDELVITSSRPGFVEIAMAGDVIDDFAGCLTPGTYPPDYLAKERARWRTSSSTQAS